MSKKRPLGAASPTGNTKKRRPVAKEKDARKASPSPSDSAFTLRDQPDTPSFPHDHDSPTTASLLLPASEEPSTSSVSVDKSSSASADIPCIECAKRAFQECNDGVIRPNYCVFDDPSEDCMRCVDKEEDCEPLPQPFRSLYNRLQAMNPDFAALAAAEDFGKELQKRHDAILQENSVATQLKVLNRTLLLLLNDRRESASKERLGEEHLVEWIRGWENAEKRLEQKHGL
ncbi:hypothetical protein BJX68DRAFT_269322 [Aspergillus pseudodeflectus]|uniref:Uncharacterized protein n=1 Tax=Aspergillus pseudodeflectus TaxID=176178 RepID=A0ABR4JYS6_9EURO